jgi:hypothetical protein
MFSEREGLYVSGPYSDSVDRGGWAMFQSLEDQLLTCIVERYALEWTCEQIILID